MIAQKLPPILLVGCGKMGSAMLTGWLARGVEQVIVVKPGGNDFTDFGADISFCRDTSDIPPDFSPAAVVFAIKPQQAAAVIPSYTRFADAGAVMLSIMAGKTTSGIAAALGGKTAVVRAMPNTPATVGQGFTCAVAGLDVAPEQRELCDALLHAVGEVAWVDDERFIDAVTAISGGGPAYVFLLAELLEAAAVEQGLPPELARGMARHTIVGSGALLAASHKTPAELRAAVTSPQGTTERALGVLIEPDAWPKLMSEAITAATLRSRELADQVEGLIHAKSEDRQSHESTSCGRHSSEESDA